MKLITTLRMCALGSILLYIVHDSTVTAASTIVGFQTDVVRISSGNGATDSLVNTTNEAISILMLPQV